MKKDVTTKERKGTPNVTKEKDCKGCPEEGRPTYKIIEKKRTEEPDTWEVTFEKWFGCYCNKKTDTVTLVADGGRLVGFNDLVKAGY